ncbi:MAG: M61 family metallopeptidase [Sphingobium sp.]|nr:M61 family metallopeptidase [Sphingobium sp.]MBP6112475.1 M61 family metallopeptidase [Sphingobium sp.]MBP8672107.1 M61 family metallopeptidase [Sphingobium sp.]MBP9158821.1 M61 family metallopeptidase [Sphingobium sp.]MCC6481717.1 M61 family metallopeptidase [Sphingomonadaceae bacterium]
MRLCLAVSLLCAAPMALAQTPAPAPASRSAPAAQPILDTIPAARDIPYPGTIRLEVDASDTTQRIWRVRQTIPVSSSGPLVLLYPEWLPGKHAPRGAIDKLAGLRISANGKDIGWRRSPLDVYAFHVNVPEGAREVVAEFQFLNPTTDTAGRISVTDKMLNLSFDMVSLYPAGYFVRQIPVVASVIYPAGWAAYGALRGKLAGASMVYEPTDYETLVDSPVFAGKYAGTVDLGSAVTLNMVADSKEELAGTPEQVNAHKKLVAEAVALFGARHFDRYDFLLAISDEMGGIGLEHHRSSENGVDTGYFTKWNDGPADRNLLPHELVHSWNGKFRRPEMLWTPDYRTPMQDSLLWVYEGQTQFWGYVLGARSGLYSKEQTLDALASIAARLDLAKGRNWRALEDTTFDPIIAARRPKNWASWQRAEDYYNEGLLVWLEADAVIRRESKGARGMDDFARAFFGVRDGDWGVLTYTRQDVITTLNAVQPYDWAGFLSNRVDRTTGEAPKAGLTLGGYALAYTDTPNSTTKEVEKAIKGIDQTYGIGLAVKNDGEILTAIWDSPAFKAGLAPGMKILGINGTEYSGEIFKAALGQAKADKRAIELIVRQDKNIRVIRLDYSLGLRYPRLTKTGEGEGSLDRLLQSKTTSP